MGAPDTPSPQRTRRLGVEREKENPKKLYSPLGEKIQIIPAGNEKGGRKTKNMKLIEEREKEEKKNLHMQIGKRKQNSCFQIKTSTYDT